MSRLQELLGAVRISRASVPPTFGADIDAVHSAIFSATPREKSRLLLSWAQEYQPCIFGRLGAAGRHGIHIDTCIVTDAHLAEGELRLRERLQVARRAWKDRCAAGLSQAILYVFCHRALAFARPSPEFEEMSRILSECIFPEFAPIQPDTIYSESVPLDINGKVYVFKAGINIFHPTAHLTANHDRRIPGGVVVSVNSVGHYANCLFHSHAVTTFGRAVERVRRLAWASIGNGGIGDPRAVTTSWRSATRQCADEPPVNDHYGAFYHTDVLIPSRLTRTVQPIDQEASDCWPFLRLDYFNAEPMTCGDDDCGMFYGSEIDRSLYYFNSWAPVRAVNSKDFRY